MMPPRPRLASSRQRRRLASALCAICIALGSASATTAQTLPAEVTAALARARVPPDALSAIVVGVGVDPRPTTTTPPRLSHRADVPRNPASVMKLVTTFAALDLLGPAFTWRTSVYLDGALHGGTLRGNLVIRGGGDPKLVAERLWLLLRRVRGLGVHEIAGDIVLDASAFEPLAVDPAAFDDEPLKPYNAAPDALLVNFGSIVFHFVPDPPNRVARVHHEPPLAEVELPRSVPLTSGECRGDWRAALRADFSDPAQVRFDGSFPAACGEKAWGVALPRPERFTPHAIAGMWRAVGGTLSGRVRSGRAPDGVAPTFEIESPPLADLIRDINKFSNNPMARQLFLTLSLRPHDDGSGTSANAGASIAGSREVLQRWWRERFGAGRGVAAEAPFVDNGAGLSRDARLRADALARMLQAAFASPLMPEFVASLPIQGVDGTLRRRTAGAATGAAHLKGGSLRDVAALAGYVDGASGRRWALVAIVNDPNAPAARGALDALVEWTRNDVARAASAE